jgi:hypothetical protein
MAIIVASAEIRDDEFLTAFHSCELPASSFRQSPWLE